MAASSPAIAQGDGSLQAEVRLLEEARRSLDGHAPADALSALDRYAKEFPGGHLGIEARALQIEALLAAGKRDAARTLAQSFLSSYPRSPVAIRVRHLLDATDRGAPNP